MTTYAFPPGGHPDQSASPVGTAVFTQAYAVIPAETQRDIVTLVLAGVGWHAGMDFGPPPVGLCRDIRPIRNGIEPRRRQQRS